MPDAQLAEVVRSLITSTYKGLTPARLQDWHAMSLAQPGGESRLERGVDKNDRRCVMTTRTAEQRFHSFAEFYPYYLQEHSNPACRRLHYVGSILVLVVLAYALATQ
ncbi:Mpo1-like protein, partial [Acinetobacter radioresistens]|uniref:Mpo1-like protein n=1 Tax=Acinetobacter radioresistens TaxID=40216 RepID=UPI0035A22E3B